MMFRTVFNTFFEICLLQRGPQDLPTSRSFLRSLLISLALAGFVINMLFLPASQSILTVVLNLSVMVIITQLLLRLHKKSERYVQTLTALAGTGLVLALLGLPIFVLLAIAESQDNNSPIGAILWLALFCWELMITAHILRNATDAKYGQGILMAMLYPLIYFQLARYLLPA